MHRLLAETPEPFSAATTEKRGALSHFQPHAVLVTDPPSRAPRRALNEEALDTRQPVHRHGHRMLEVVTTELDALHARVGWTDFRDVWSRAVRRIVLGDKAADDTELTSLLDGRSDGDWPLIPFSDGPAVCPGRNVVLLTTSVAVSHLVSQYELDVDPATTAKLHDPLPTTFDHTTPRIGIWTREVGAGAVRR